MYAANNSSYNKRIAIGASIVHAVVRLSPVLYNVKLQLNKLYQD